MPDRFSTKGVMSCTTLSYSYSLQELESIKSILANPNFNLAEKNPSSKNFDAFILVLDTIKMKT